MKRIYLLIILVAALVIGVWFRVNQSSDAKPSSSTQNPTKSITKPTPTIPSFDKNKYSKTDPTSIWVVANKQHPLNPSGYAPTDLVSVGNGQKMRQEAATALTTMIADARAQGLVIIPLSGYRSYQTQVGVYANEVKKYGQVVADSQSAKPGYSEHQTGLAIDVGGGGCVIEDCFGNTKEGKWVADNAYKYGYIVRYTDGNQAVTGYRAEPWHIRYIGPELSKEMHEKSISTLEQFFGL